MKMTHYLRESIEEKMRSLALPGKIAPCRILGLCAETVEFCVSIQAFWPETEITIVAYPFSDYLGDDPDKKIRVIFDSPIYPQAVYEILPQYQLCVVGGMPAMDEGQNLQHREAAKLGLPFIIGLLPEYMESEDEYSKEERLHGVINFCRIYTEQEYETYLVTREGKIYPLEECESSSIIEEYDFIAAFGVNNRIKKWEKPSLSSLPPALCEAFNKDCLDLFDKNWEKYRQTGMLTERFMIDPFMPRLGFPLQRREETEGRFDFRISRDAIFATIIIHSDDFISYFPDVRRQAENVGIMNIDGGYFPDEVSWLVMPLQEFSRYMQEALLSVTDPWGMVINGVFTRAPNKMIFLPLMLRHIYFDAGFLTRFANAIHCHFFFGISAMRQFTPVFGASGHHASSICDSRTVWKDWYERYDDSFADGPGISPALKNAMPDVAGDMILPVQHGNVDSFLLKALFLGEKEHVRMANAILEGIETSKKSSDKKGDI